eukprot:scaffold5822_cov129-Skeletonema_marinoi.AAC.1
MAKYEAASTTGRPQHYTRGRPRTVHPGRKKEGSIRSNPRLGPGAGSARGTGSPLGHWISTLAPQRNTND